jgi:hypothetical protein
MKRNYLKKAFVSLFAVAALCSCGKDDDSKDSESADCEILSFNVNGEEWGISGTDITQLYPTVITSLTPVISLSPGAVVNPPANEAQNFFAEQGVSYTVTAGDGTTTKTYTVKALVASGTTGECTWTITGESGNYTLTISGNGSMDYYFYGKAPWHYQNSIKTLVIQDGVTVIGERAFYACYGLTSVSIGNSVLYIGKQAFAYCSGLTSVSTGNSVTHIDEQAFIDCSGLTSVPIGNSVTYIGDLAFAGCSGLTNVTIPNSVTNIGNSFSACRGLTGITIGSSITDIDYYAFLDCSSLTSIHVDAANEQYSSENGILFSKDRTALVLYPPGKTGSYDIPSSVTVIGTLAFFDCHGLTGVSIPNSVTYISSGAFSNCSGLTAISIPNSVIFIGQGAFSNCSGLTTVTVPGSVADIFVDAFPGCSNLTSIHADAANEQYSSENGILFNKDKTMLTRYPEGKTGSYAIPNSVTSIGINAFEGCRGLTGVSIPNSVTYIGSGAFSDCRGLTAVNIPNSVITVDDGAFSMCSGLITVTIPGSVTSIGNWAFSDCKGLTSVVCLIDHILQYLPDNIFANVNTSACTLKVPASAVNDYKVAPVWSYFGNIEAIPDEEE